MKNEEIRINNFVQNNGMYYRVTPNIFMYIQSCNTRYEPVPLSKKILDSANIEIEDFTSNKGFLYVQATSYSFGSFYEVYWKGTQIATVRYLHQLQNIFYDLTGKEITFKTKNGNPPKP